MDIRMAGVTKIFHPDIVALEDVYLNVKKANSSISSGTRFGKDHASAYVNRELSPSSGQIIVGKYNLRKMRLGQLPFYRRQVGWSFRISSLPHLNAAENVAFVLEAIGMPGSRSQRGSRPY